MNNLKLLALIGITSGLVTGSSLGVATPMGESREHPIIGTIEAYDFPEISPTLRLVLAGRLVVASADSGYEPVGC